MAARYTELYRLKNSLYTEKCPLVIETGALLKDNKLAKVLAQIKVRNICERTIIAFKLSVRAQETSGNELEGVKDFPFLDIDLSYGMECGSQTPIYLPNDTTRVFIPCITEVVFQDKTVWKHESAQWMIVPKAESLSEKIGEELAKQYSIEVSGNCEYYPQKNESLFLCTCGAVVGENATVCYGCKRPIKTLMENLDAEWLKGRLEERYVQEQKEKEEKAKSEKLEQERQAEEEKKKQEELKIQEARTRKQRKIYLLIASAVAIIVIAIAAFNTYIAPGIRFEYVEELCDTGKYQEAYDSIRSNDWKYVDENRVIWCKARCQFGLQRYSDAITSLDSMKQNDDVAELLSRCYYELGKQDLDNGKLDSAISYLEKTDYSDATKLLSDAKAKVEEENKNNDLIQKYQDAIVAMFLGDYSKVDETIESFPEGFVDNNSEVKAFINAWNNADEEKKNAGIWYSYRYDKKDSDGYYMGLSFIDGKIGLADLYFFDSDNLKVQLDVSDYEYITKVNYQIWQKDASNVYSMYSMADKSEKLETRIISDDGQRMEEYDDIPNKSFENPNGTPELKSVYVR